MQSASSDTKGGDPACGAGAMLIAARNALSRKGFGSNDVLFIAQDIDRVTALMCYIQLSLLGCAGYVIIADSLSHPAVSAADSPLEIVQMPEQDIWIMPALSDDVWKWRRLLTQIERVIK